MSHQVARPRQYLQFLCCGWESSSSSLGNCAASRGQLLLGLRGYGLVRGSAFPRPNFWQQPIVRSSWLEMENLAHTDIVCAWVQVLRFC